MSIFTNGTASFKLCQFKPVHGLNPETQAMYDGNICGSCRSLSTAPTRPQLIEGVLFRMIITTPEFGVKAETSAQTETATPEVQRMLAVFEGEMTRGELMDALGLKDDKHFRENYQQTGIALDLIEMTIPDKHRSSKQRYRLTEKGREIVSS